MIGDVLDYSFDDLEYHHDFIQWLFPLTERSNANPSAPVLSLEEIGAFRASHEAQDSLLRSLDVMLAFYGLGRHSHARAVDRAPSFSARSRNWLTPGNHNFLRLTRILRSLTILGQPAEARALLVCLRGLASDPYYATPIGSRTLAFWEAAPSA